MNVRHHLLVACMALAAACGDKTGTKTATEDRPATTATEPETTEPAATPAPSAPAPSEVATTEEADVKLTDAQIVHVLSTVNTGEVEAARMAKSKSKNEAVLTFAQAMIDDHGAAEQKVQALATRLGPKAEDDELSKKLKEEHQAATARLQALQGEAFDKAYIDQMVMGHAKVLGLVEDELVADAQDAELEALLTDLKAKVAMHHDHARKVQVQLSSMPAQTN